MFLRLPGVSGSLWKAQTFLHCCWYSQRKQKACTKIYFNFEISNSQSKTTNITYNVYNTSVCLWSLIVLITSRYTEPFLGDVSRLSRQSIITTLFIRFPFQSMSHLQIWNLGLCNWNVYCYFKFLGNEPVTRITIGCNSTASQDNLAN